MFVTEDRPSRRMIGLSASRIAAVNGSALCYSRFLQADPLGYEDGTNMYDYVGGDPVNKADPTGMVAGADDIIVIGTVAKFTPLVVGTASSIAVTVFKVFSSIFGGGHHAKPPRTNTNSNPDQTQQKTFQQSSGLSACQQAFFAKELANRGLPTNHLSNVRFVSGLNSRAGYFTKKAFAAGASAVTQGNIIFVPKSGFSKISSFSNPTSFEEIAHTAQFNLLGSSKFYYDYGISSVMGVISGLDNYGGNLLETSAKLYARQMYKAYQSAGC